MITIQALLNTLPQTGTVSWIGLRPYRRATIDVVQQVETIKDTGLVGDRYAGTAGKRQVTLIQAEHLPVMASLLTRESVDPALLRRNICVSGINLLALKGRSFQIGDAVLEFTGLCHPCSFMEEVFGDGGYNAVRGHGGITASVVQSGTIRLNDTVRAIPKDTETTPQLSLL